MENPLLRRLAISFVTARLGDLLEVFAILLIHLWNFLYPESLAIIEQILRSFRTTSEDLEVLDNDPPISRRLNIVKNDLRKFENYPFTESNSPSDSYEVKKHYPSTLMNCKSNTFFIKLSHIFENSDNFSTSANFGSQTSIVECNEDYFSSTAADDGSDLYFSESSYSVENNNYPLTIEDENSNTFFTNLNDIFENSDYFSTQTNFSSDSTLTECDEDFKNENNSFSTQADDGSDLDISEFSYNMEDFNNPNILADFGYLSNLTKCSQYLENNSCHLSNLPDCGCDFCISESIEDAPAEIRCANINQSECYKNLSDISNPITSPLIELDKETWVFPKKLSSKTNQKSETNIEYKESFKDENKEILKEFTEKSNMKNGVSSINQKNEENFSESLYSRKQNIKSADILSGNCEVSLQSSFNDKKLSDSNLVLSINEKCLKNIKLEDENRKTAAVEDFSYSNSDLTSVERNCSSLEATINTVSSKNINEVSTSTKTLSIENWLNASSPYSNVGNNSEREIFSNPYFLPNRNCCISTDNDSSSMNSTTCAGGDINQEMRKRKKNRVKRMLKSLTNGLKKPFKR